ERRAAKRIMMDQSASDRGEVIRNAREADLPELARAVAAQPLMQRYGTGAETLEKSLRGALARGEELIVIEDGEGACGLAWFLPSGTFALGGYLRLIAVIRGREGGRRVAAT